MGVKKSPYFETFMLLPHFQRATLLSETVISRLCHNTPLNKRSLHTKQSSLGMVVNGKAPAFCTRLDSKGK